MTSARWRGQPPEVRHRGWGIPDTDRDVRALFLLVLLVVIVVVGMRFAGIPVPFLDYRPSIAGPELNRPGVQVDPPGFDEFQAP
jgi:hypothetical protein